MCVCVFSAGVGRTGVLIGMLTAWSYMEAGIGVDMLSIVQQMRDQRAVLIQTSVSDGVLTNTSHCTQHESTTVYVTWCTIAYITLVYTLQHRVIIVNQASTVALMLLCCVHLSSVVVCL